MIAVILRNRSIKGSVKGVVENLKKTNPNMDDNLAHQIAEGQIGGPDIPKIMDVSNDHMRKISQQ